MVVVGVFDVSAEEGVGELTSCVTGCAQQKCDARHRRPESRQTRREGLALRDLGWLEECTHSHTV